MDEFDDINESTELIENKQEKHDMRVEYNKLIHNINEFKEEHIKISNDGTFDMLTVILSYCEHNDLDIKEVGDILADDLDFVSIFEKNLYKNHHIKDVEKPTAITIKGW